MNLFMRIGLWFGCLLLAVGLFSVLFIRFYGASGEVMFIVRVTMMFALPVWLLYLPIIFKLRDAEDNRIWIILGSGILIGPLALTIWCLILQLFGGDAHAIWRGDDLAPSTVACMIFASVVGFMATLPYGIVLKIFHHQSAVATGKVT